MTRRFMASFVVLGVATALVLGGTPSSVFAATVGPTNVGGFEFTADDSDIAAGADLTLYTGAATNVIIPSTVVLAGNTYDVTSVHASAFSGNATMVSVSIPNTVTTLGDFGFSNDTALTSIAIPDSVTTIGNNEFQNDSALVSAVVGNGVGGLPNSTFQNDPALVTLVLGNSVGGIGDFAIAFDSALTTITFGTSLIQIGNYSFFGDTALTSVVLPPTLLGIGADAFNAAPNLVHVEFLGATPSLITAAGPDASLGTASGLIVYYPWAFDSAQVGAGGFTAPLWRGYSTVELATVSFDLRGHGSAILPQKVEVGSTATAPAPASAGFIFNGWYTDSSLTTKANFADPITADSTLFASWSALAITGEPLDPWLLPGAMTMFVAGLLLVIAMRRRESSREHS